MGKSFYLDPNTGQKIYLPNYLTPIDQTLTERGKAADAKSTGDAIRAINISASDTGGITDYIVDSLSTAKKAQKYLLHNTNDIYYLSIKNDSIQFIKGTTTGATVQAEDREGNLLYWKDNIDAATIDENGYPYLNNKRLYSSTTETEYPVLIYSYTETVKAEFKFDDETPTINFGDSIISQQDNDLIISHGEQSIILGEDGFVDINKMRKPTKFDFSNIDDGSFVEYIDGGAEIGYSVTTDSEGRIISITDDQGHETEVVW